MNQQIKKEWLEALRSGEYKQGKGALHPSDAFCCLGVLCDITKEKFGLSWGGFIDHANIGGCTTCLPHVVCDFAGLVSANPRIKGVYLADLNDGTVGQPSLSFTEIANLIEKHL